MTREQRYALEEKLATPLNPYANVAHAIVHDCDVAMLQLEAVIEVLDLPVPRLGAKQHWVDVLAALASAQGVIQGVMGVVGPVVAGDMPAGKMEELILAARREPPIIGNGHKET